MQVGRSLGVGNGNHFGTIEEKESTAKWNFQEICLKDNDVGFDCGNYVKQKGNTDIWRLECHLLSRVAYINSSNNQAERIQDRKECRHRETPKSHLHHPFFERKGL